MMELGIQGEDVVGEDQGPSLPYSRLCHYWPGPPGVCAEHPCYMVISMSLMLSGPPCPSVRGQKDYIGAHVWTRAVQARRKGEL